MNRILPKVNELRHISAQEFCDHMDDYFDEVIKEDTALAIDTDRNSYVLCPASWFQMEFMDNGHFNIAMTCALRYAINQPTGIDGTMAMIICESLPQLNNHTIRGMIRDVDERLEFRPSSFNPSTLGQLRTDLSSYLSARGS